MGFLKKEYEDILRVGEKVEVKSTSEPWSKCIVREVESIEIYNDEGFTKGFVDEIEWSEMSDEPSQININLKGEGMFCVGLCSTNIRRIK